jgi:hypothetical protein
MDLLNIINHGLIYITNGILVTIYFLISLMPALVSLASALLLILTLDKDVQNSVNYRPSRNGPMGSDPMNRRDALYTSTETSSTMKTSQVLTIIAIGLWLIAQTGMAAPVPWIGASMWVFAVIVLFILPDHRRYNQLWFIKSWLVIYAIAVIGSRLYIHYTSQLSASQWANIIGSAQTASTVIATTKGNTTTIITYALWFIVPLGFFAKTLRELFVNPINLLSPKAGVQEVLRRIRVR